MIRRATIAGGLAAATAVTGAHAHPMGQPAGAQLTYGGSAPHEVAIAVTGNPATPSLGERRVRAGLANIGLGIEIGEADDFDQDLEDIGDQFDALEMRFDTVDTSNQNQIEQLVNDIIDFEDRTNLLVNDLSEDAYVRLNASVGGPAAPLSVRSQTLGGVITIDYGGYLEARAAVESSGNAFDSGLADFDLGSLTPDAQFDIGETSDGYPVLFIDAEGDDTFEDYAFEPNEDAGLAVQGGLVGRLSGGYSRELFNNGLGSLHAGATLNMYQVTLARSGVLLDDGDDAEDRAEDEFEDNQETSNGLGLDAGLYWMAGNYSAGATLKNINEPSFDYPDVCGSDPDAQSCVFFERNPQAKRNGSSWTMERQITLEGQVFTQNRRWVAGARLDANSVADTTGDEHQWAAIHGSYVPQTFWIPSPRLGYKQNLAGEELSYVMAGVTYFRALHIDAAYALETASFDGNEMPRSVQVNVALDLQF
ncbi:conjugal transfer protein TraF [Aquisalimonas asiatica]|uniref:Plasmid transfer operon, TraF, protein n=1 Tax=Aquisalimonas asiatica TaxID=406100 RepID=A0A1H8PKS8_9GAMM|nr:conjugal transfer protein TraF [Aquisalimonas asiatica]SEO42391.1 plasmid transfer operon, TraF, protein [Aquisalimonas asiatica]